MLPRANLVLDCIISDGVLAFEVLLRRDVATSHCTGLACTPVTRILGGKEIWRVDTRYQLEIFLTWLQIFLTWIALQHYQVQGCEDSMGITWGLPFTGVPSCSNL